METLASRVKQQREKLGMSQEELAKAANCQQGTIGNIEMGTRKHPRNLLALAAALGVTAEWLMSGESVASTQIAHKLPRLIKASKEDSQTIPQYDTGGKMGHGVVLREQPGVIQSWNVSNEWLRKNVQHCTSYSNLAIVTGFGDSMKGMYNPGDPLLVDVGVTTVNYDGVYFFRVGDEGFIKRLQRIPGVGLRAHSENKHYDSFDITKSMDFEVFARVLKVWRSEEY